MDNFCVCVLCIIPMQSHTLIHHELQQPSYNMSYNQYCIQLTVKLILVRVNGLPVLCISADLNQVLQNGRAPVWLSWTTVSQNVLYQDATTGWLSKNLKQAMQKQNYI